MTRTRMEKFPVEITTIWRPSLVPSTEGIASPPTWAVWTSSLTAWTTSVSPGPTSGLSWWSSRLSSLVSAASVSALEDVPGSPVSYLSSAAAVTGIPAAAAIAKRKKLPIGKIAWDCSTLWQFICLMFQGFCHDHQNQHGFSWPHLVIFGVVCPLCLIL